MIHGGNWWKFLILFIVSAGLWCAGFVFIRWAVAPSLIQCG